LIGFRIGTCGQPIDRLRIDVSRVGFVPELIVGYDGERGGWSIGASFRVGDDFEFREITFIEAERMDEDALPNAQLSGPDRGGAT
jgi:hypothetical protein